MQPTKREALTGACQEAVTAMYVVMHELMSWASRHESMTWLA